MKQKLKKSVLHGFVLSKILTIILILISIFIIAIEIKL